MPSLSLRAIVVCVLLCAPAHAQTVAVSDFEQAVSRTLRVTAIVAPTVDTISTWRNLPYNHLYERNPLFRRADGSASMARMIPIKAGYAVAQQALISAARTRRGWQKVALYSLVATADALDVYWACHNLSLPRHDPTRVMR